MATYDSTLALTLLTDAEKDRMVIAFLNNPERNTSVDWDKCILEAKSASVASFKRGIDNSLKKLKTAQESGGAGETVTPKKKLKTTPAKRKGKADAEDGEAEATPAKKKRGRKVDADGKAKSEAIAKDDEDGESL